MSRYVDEIEFANALVKKRVYSSKTIGEALGEAPSIDIVRCEDCAKWRSDRFFCTQWSCGTPAVGWCYMAKQTETHDLRTGTHACVKQTDCGWK